MSLKENNIIKWNPIPFYDKYEKIIIFKAGDKVVTKPKSNQVRFCHFTKTGTSNQPCQLNLLQKKKFFIIFVNIDC